MCIRSLFIISLALAGTSLTGSAWAISGAEAVKQLKQDSSQTLELGDVIEAATKVFHAINQDNDATLERSETSDRLADADWAEFNKDDDKTIEMNEWLAIVKARFIAADTKKDSLLTQKELDSPAGQALMKLFIK